MTRCSRSRRYLWRCTAPPRRVSQHRVQTGRVVGGLPGRGTPLPRQPAHPVPCRRGISARTLRGIRGPPLTVRISQYCVDERRVTGDERRDPDGPPQMPTRARMLEPAEIRHPRVHEACIGWRGAVPPCTRHRGMSAGTVACSAAATLHAHLGGRAHPAPLATRAEFGAHVAQSLAAIFSSFRASSRDTRIREASSPDDGLTTCQTPLLPLALGAHLERAIRQPASGEDRQRRSEAVPGLLGVREIILRDWQSSQATSRTGTGRGKIGGAAPCSGRAGGAIPGTGVCNAKS